MMGFKDRVLRRLAELERFERNEARLAPSGAARRYRLLRADVFKAAATVVAELKEEDADA